MTQGGAVVTEEDSNAKNWPQKTQKTQINRKTKSEVGAYGIRLGVVVRRAFGHKR
jgi:hypothetical protein